MTTVTFIVLNAALGGTVLYSLLRLLVAGIRPDVRTHAAGEVASPAGQRDRLAA
jgi:hypothetical protein